MGDAFLSSLGKSTMIYVAFSNSWFKDGFAETLCFNISGHENVGKKTAVCAHRGAVVFLLTVLSIKLEIIFFQD